MNKELIELGLTEYESALFRSYIKKISINVASKINHRFWKDLSMDEAELKDLLYKLSSLEDE